MLKREFLKCNKKFKENSRKIDSGRREIVVKIQKVFKIQVSPKPDLKKKKKFLLKDCNKMLLNSAGLFLHLIFHFSVQTKPRHPAVLLSRVSFS